MYVHPSTPKNTSPHITEKREKKKEVVTVDTYFLSPCRDWVSSVTKGWGQIGDR
jgi:hypothetical protein